MKLIKRCKAFFPNTRHFPAISHRLNHSPLQKVVSGVGMICKWLPRSVVNCVVDIDIGQRCHAVFKARQIDEDMF